MSDMISRQAAIDEWKKDFKGYVNTLDIPRDDYKGIMAYIDELPSAQPDLSDYSDRLWKAAYERGKAEAIDALVKLHAETGVKTAQAIRVIRELPTTALMVAGSDRDREEDDR